MNVERNQDQLRLSRIRVSTARRTVGLFLLFGALWISVTTLIGDFAINDPEALATYELVKGIVFIVLAGLIIYYYLARHATRVLAAEAESARRLEESERDFLELVDNIRDTIIVRVSPEGVIETWNAGAEATTGYAAEEMIGQTIEKLVPEDDRQPGMIEALLARAREKGVARNVGRRVRADGRKIWVETTSRPVFDDQGDLDYFSVIGRNVTEEVEQRTALEKRVLQFEILAELGRGAMASDDTFEFAADGLSATGKGLEADAVALNCAEAGDDDQTYTVWLHRSATLEKREIPVAEIHEIARDCPDFVT
ncbi:MAG: PAS domain S-box protein, partial [Thermoanaerobaculia bacterium]|nr:PAS domain S-box protein [Thermoanaerobaculia bacterium]